VVVCWMCSESFSGYMINEWVWKSRIRVMLVCSRGKLVLHKIILFSVFLVKAKGETEEVFWSSLMFTLNYVVWMLNFQAVCLNFFLTAKTCNHFLTICTLSDFLLEMAYGCAQRGCREEDFVCRVFVLIGVQLKAWLLDMVVIYKHFPRVWTPSRLLL